MYKDCSDLVEQSKLNDKNDAIYQDYNIVSKNSEKAIVFNNDSEELNVETISKETICECFNTAIFASADIKFDFPNNCGTFVITDDKSKSIPVSLEKRIHNDDNKYRQQFFFAVNKNFKKQDMMLQSDKLLLDVNSQDEFQLFVFT